MPSFTLLPKAQSLHTWAKQNEALMSKLFILLFQVSSSLRTNIICLPAVFWLFLVCSLSSAGHDCVEVVSVTAYFYTNDKVHPCEGKAYLEYLRDVPQEAAEYLSANRGQFGPHSYQEVLQRFPVLSQAAGGLLCGGLLHYRDQIGPSLRDDLKLLDEKITLAMSSMDYPLQWKNTDCQPGEGNETGRRVTNELKSKG